MASLPLAPSFRRSLTRSLPFAGADGRRGRSRAVVVRLPQGDLGAVTQAIGAVHHDALARRQSGRDGDAFALTRTERDLPHRDRVILIDRIDERAGRTALHG